MQPYFLNIYKSLDKESQKVFRNIMIAKSSIYQIILKRYHKNEQKLEQDLKKIFLLLKQREKVVPISLPMFASFTGDPHFLNFNSSNNTLFLKIMAFQNQEKEPLTTEEKIEFLAKYKIYVDDLSNAVITYGLTSNTSFIEWARKINQPIHISLKNYYNR